MCDLDLEYDPELDLDLEDFDLPAPPLPPLPPLASTKHVIETIK